MAHLVFFRRGQELMRVAIDRPRTTLGRGAQAEVVIPDSGLLSIQATILHDEEGFHLIDHSGGRTLVAGKAVERARLVEGIDLALGSFRAIFHEASYSEGPAAGEGKTIANGLDVPELPREIWILAQEVGHGGPGVQAPLGDELVLGSAQGCGLRLNHPTVSAKHARIVRHEGRLLLQDLGSTNGTSIQGVRVYEVELPLGARVRIGPWEFWASAMGPRPIAARATEFEGILTKNAAMLALFAQIERVAASQAPVAIFGETGTGKELVARAIHRLSRRASGNFVPINCASIARELMESEMFGHEKGAFTGAMDERDGAFTEADGGTLFLDEIGELPPELQPKLLRAVELGEVKRLGSNRPFTVDVRFVCATHRTLGEEVRQRRFREDLYYRLAVATLHLPPLRQRRGDLMLLWEHFIRVLAPEGLQPKLSDEASALLMNHPWPGNVRELRNVAQRALLSLTGPVVLEGDLQFDPSLPLASGADLIDPRGLTLAQAERLVIAAALHHHHGNRRAVAKQLDIAKSTLLKKLLLYALENEGRDGTEPPEE